MRITSCLTLPIIPVLSLLERMVNSAVSSVVICQLPQKDIKSNETRDIELARGENLKTPNFSMFVTSY